MFRITVIEEMEDTDNRAPIKEIKRFEQCLDTLDIKALFDVLNKKKRIRKCREKVDA